MHAKSLQSCPTLCNPMDYSPPSSSVHEILQARMLEWVAMPSSNTVAPHYTHFIYTYTYTYIYIYVHSRSLLVYICMYIHIHTHTQCGYMIYTNTYILMCAYIFNVHMLYICI